MCLLISGPSNKIRAQLLTTQYLLDDIFKSNADGVGVMYPSAKGVTVRKILPKTIQGVTDFIGSLPTDEREVALHFRYRTHGDIDLLGVHPVQINEGAWLMHNGILDTGNAADKTKSDTWHFAKDYLAHLPHDILHDKAILEMMAAFIENNRFAICTADGRLSVVNREQGIEHEGVWYSNTYAWTPELLIPNYRGKWSSHMSTWRGHGAGSSVIWPTDDDEDDYQDDLQLAYEIDEALSQCDADGLAKAILGVKREGIEYILNSYKVEVYHTYKAADNDHDTNKAVKAWIEEDASALLPIPLAKVCQALVYCCDWSMRPITDDTQVVAKGEVVDAAPEPAEQAEVEDVVELKAYRQAQAQQMALGYEAGAFL